MLPGRKCDGGGGGQKGGGGSPTSTILPENASIFADFKVDSCVLQVAEIARGFVAAGGVRRGWSVATK